MPPEIRELDAETRDRIAAGEVVERPASVVKELLENALDAGASRIDVAVEGGGIDRIAVSDDGIGMDESAVKKAVREHTTSKLRAVGDLDSIGTLGFRGEALHAIGSIARLRIETKPRGGSRGTELVVENGELVSCGPIGCPEGTTVEVTELFGNVPARRKYLKTEATEFDHVARVATGYALAQPGVAIGLERDGRETFATTGDGDRESAVMAVYGRDVASAMIPVEFDGGDGPLAGVEGLVSHPETNRAGREYLTTLIDGRYVTSSAVREAIVDAYGSQLAPDRYPFAVIDLRLPPGGVDVNVHPRKLEVLFADEEGVTAGVKEAVESALSEAGLLRTRAPRGRSAPEQTEVAAGSRSDHSSERTETRAKSQSDSNVDPESAPQPDRNRDGEIRSETAEPPTGSRSAPPTERSDTTAASTVDEPRADSTPDGADEQPDDTASPSTDSTGGDSPDRSRVRPPTTQRTLDGAETAGTPEEFERLPSMTVLGQFDDTYLVAETADGLLLVDQHAADERVNYERLRAAFDGGVTTQTLAEPVVVGLTAREAELADAYVEALSRLGFRVREASEDARGPSDRSLEVTTVPAILAERVGEAAPDIARDLLEEFVGGDPEGTVDSVVDDILGDLACHPSIKGNTSLREGTVTGLLEALDDCENPYACPHGRPTVIELPIEEIEDRFERDYPGHGGRRR